MMGSAVRGDFAIFASVLLLGPAVGCRLATSDAHAEAAPPPAAPLAAKGPAPEPPEPPAANTVPGLRFAGSDFVDTQILDQLQQAEPTAFKPVGSTSTVFRMRLRGPIDGAFKTATKARPLGPADEVAAYRVARCLHLDNVPPVVSRDLPLRTLQARLEAESADKWPEIAERLIVTGDGMVRGAAIYWVKDLSDLGLGEGAARTTVLRWLRGDGPLPEAKRPLARTLSDMLAFDYLIANADRWSGDNVKGDAAGSRVYIRDHDLAFGNQSPSQHRKQWSVVSRVERFSRAFYGDLRRLSRGCIERELLEDPRGESGELLSDRQVRAVLDRKQALVSHVQALIAERGERDVLVFE